MRIAPILLALLLLLCGVLVSLTLVEEPANGAGMAHHQYDTMLMGANSSRHNGLLGLAWVYGTLQMLFFVGLLRLALVRRGRRPSGLGWLYGGLVLYLTTFAALMLSYRQFAIEPSGRLFLSFPAPTAWMLYGIWVVPVIFLLLYIVRFDDWVMDEADHEKFQKLVAERSGR